MYNAEISTLCGGAVCAIDIDLHPVAHNLSVYLFCKRPQHPLNRRVSEVSHLAASYAHCVMVMADTSEAVLWRAIRHRQLAERSKFDQQLDSSVDRSSADTWHGLAQVLSREGVFLRLYGIYDMHSGRGQTETTVLESGYQVVTLRCGTSHTVSLLPSDTYYQNYIHNMSISLASEYQVEQTGNACSAGTGAAVGGESALRV
jgi:hypothetical protein